MIYTPRHRRPRTVRQTLAAIAATGLVSAGLAVVPGTANAVGGSTFESADGNMAFDGLSGKTKDWATVTSSTAFHQAKDLPSGQKDNSLGQGSKDDDLTVTVVTGSIPKNKDDLTKAYEYQDTGTDGKQYLYLAWERANTIGTANMSWELDQSPHQPDLTTAGTKTVQRTAGDALVTFDFAQGGSNPTIGLSRWVTSGDPKAVCQANNTVPCWGPITKLSDLSPPTADGQVNATGFTDPVSGVKLAQYEFGELGINLTDTGLISGCQGFAKAWLRSRSSTAFDAELKDFIAPFDVNVKVPLDASGAHADSLNPANNDGAVALRVTDAKAGSFDLPGTTDQSSATTTSSQTGPGSAHDENSLADVQVPPVAVNGVQPGDLVTAKVLSESSQSDVDAPTATASQTTVAEVAGLNILNGTVTADVLSAVSRTTASPNGAATFSQPSGVAVLSIDTDGSSLTKPKTFTAVPGLMVPLSEAAFGKDSYVAVLQEDPQSSHPPFGTLGTVGTYQASLDVIYVHVHITDRDPGLLTPGDQTLDVQVSRAYGLSRYTGIVCTAPQEVSGNASTLKASAPLYSSVPLSLGTVQIAPSGGHDSATVATVQYPNSGLRLVSAGVANTDTYGFFDPTQAVATSYANVASVCVSEVAGGTCVVTAKAVYAQANAKAVNGSRSADGRRSRLLSTRTCGSTSWAPIPSQGRPSTSGTSSSTSSTATTLRRPWAVDARPVARQASRSTRSTS